MVVSAAFSFGVDLFGPVCTAAVLVVRDDGAIERHARTFADGYAASDWAVRLGVPPDQAAEALARAATHRAGVGPSDEGRRGD